MPPVTTGSASPVSGGLALPTIPARVPEHAGNVRAAAVSAALGSVELRLPRPPADQRTLNCCVSCALGAAMEIIHPRTPSLAALFNYYVTRFERGAADAAGNLDLAAAIMALTTRGICRSELHRVSFDEAGASTQPTELAFADGKTRALRMRGIQVRFLQASGASRAVWAREQLRQGRPVVIGLLLPKIYERSMSGEFDWLNPQLPLFSSGHCVLATGYNDAKQALRIRDSRGPYKFDRGYWWLGYRVADAAPVQSMYSLIP